MRLWLTLSRQQAFAPTDRNPLAADLLDFSDMQALLDRLFGERVVSG
jgi:hypothetical protein